MIVKLLISLFLAVVIVICCGTIHSTYQHCKEDRFGDGYFMMIICILPLMGNIGASTLMYYVINAQV